MRLNGILLSAAALCALASPCFAGFDVCNHSKSTVSVALGYHDKEHGWLSTGWWNIAPRKCESLLTGELNNQYYYVYAEDDHDGVWSAHKDQEGGFFCMKTGKFTFHNEDFENKGVIDCEGNAARTKQFISVDTKNHPDFEYSLED